MPFQAQKASLEFGSACESHQAAVGSQEPMARNEDGQRVLGGGLPHGPGGPGFAEVGGQAAVRAKLSEGNRLKLGPYLLLENRSAGSQWNLEFFPQSGKKFTKLMGEGLESFRILLQSQGFWLTMVVHDGVGLGEAGQLGGPGIGFSENMKMPQTVQVGDG